MKNEQNLDLTPYDVEVILSAVELCLEMSEVPPHWEDASISVKVKLENQMGNISADEAELILNSMLLMKSLTNKQKATIKKGSKQFKYIRKVSADIERVLKIIKIRFSQAEERFSQAEECRS